MAVSSPFALTEKPLMVQARVGRWFPIAVTLNNTGESVSGEVRLRLLSGSGSGFDVAPNDFYAPVDLPSNSNKVVWLYGRMERALVAGFEVTFSGRGFAAISQQGSLQEPDEDQRVVVTIANSDDGLANTLKGLRGQALFRFGNRANGPRLNPNTQPVRPFQASRTMVPDRWFGFDAADMVVLGDFPHATLDTPQIAALRGYVQGGGNLVVVGGGNSARLATSPLKDLWPIAPKSSSTASSGEVQGLVHSYVTVPKNGADRLGGAPVQVVRGLLDARAVLKGGTENAPLFALRDEGAGRCLFLAYNPAEPPFQGWSGQGRLWSDVFNTCTSARRFDGVDGDFLNSGSGITPGYNSRYTGSFNNGGYGGYEDSSGPSTLTGQLLQVMARAPQLKMPAVSRIAWFLALYVFFLVPVNYAVLRFIDRRELAWVTIPVIVVVFSLWAYSAALSIRGKAILTRQVDVVQSTFGSWKGRDDSLMWIFSPRRTTYDLVSTGESAAVSDYANESGTNQGAFSILEPGDGASLKAESANIYMWTDRSFVAQSLVPLGKGVQLTGNSLVNNTPYDLEGAVWVRDQTVWSLGKIARGKSAPITGKGDRLGADISGGITRAGKLSSVFDAFTNSNGLPAQVMSTILSSNLGKLNSDPMLIAWGKEPVAALEVNGAQSSNTTLFVFRAAKTPTALASREATVSRIAFEPFEAGAGARNPNYTAPGTGGYEFYNCVLPAQGELTLQARGQGVFKPVKGRRYYGNGGAYSTSPGSLQFEVKDSRSNNWLPLKGNLVLDGTPTGGWNYKATINRSWARQPDWSLQIRARVSSQNVQISSLGIRTP